MIVINKEDLDTEGACRYWKEMYENIGYKVFLTSKYKPDTIKPLMDELDSHTNLFCGQSGVGKSSILNMIDPTLNLRIGEISESTSKGTHTTVTALMQKVDKDTFVIDTPGIREFDPYGISKENLGHYFADFNRHLIDCKFNTCTHHHEPGCSVIEALKNEVITVERYESYLNLLDTVEDDMFI